MPCPNPGGKKPRHFGAGKRLWKLLNKALLQPAPSGSADTALSGLLQRNLGTPGRAWKITLVSPASTAAVFRLALLLNWPRLPENPSGCLGFHSLTHGVSEDQIVKLMVILCNLIGIPEPEGQKSRRMAQKGQTPLAGQATKSSPYF